MIETLMALAAENGFSHWAAADMSALTPRQDVRDMCRADRCGRWNASWSCPPACGTLEQTAADIRRFDAGIVVQTTGALADEFDYAAMEDIQKGAVGDIPRHLKNVHADSTGAEKAPAYKYPHNYPQHYVEQRYLPETLGDRTYYEYGENKTEQAAKRYWDEIKRK